MTLPPGARQIGDPKAEAERLAGQRLDPPGREWGVLHPHGHGLGPERVSVKADGHPFGTRHEAGLERATLNSDCGYCDEGAVHSLVWRDPAAWVSG